MKKRFLVLFLVFALIFSMVGCKASSEKKASSSPDSEERQTIEFWMLPIMDESEIKVMVDEFNAQSETTQVNLNILAWTDGREQIKQAVAAGSGPDVFYLSAGLDASLVEAGMLLPLDEYGYTEEDIGKYTSLIEASIFEDHLYSAPLSYETYVMYYRTDILEEYGFNELPRTWEDVKTMAASITEQSGGEVMGFQFKGADDQINALNMSWLYMLAEYDGKILDPETKQSIQDSPEGEKALEFMKSFYDEGISTFGTSANTAFREGVLAMYTFNNSVMITERFLGDPELEGKWTVSAMPGKSGYINGHGLSANVATENPENCVEFMKWCSSPEKAPEWMKANFSVPPYDIDKLTDNEKAGINAVYEEDLSIWKELVRAAEKSDVEMFKLNCYGYTARWDAQKRLILAALNGEMSVKDALKQIDLEINQAM